MTRKLRNIDHQACLNCTNSIFVLYVLYVFHVFLARYKEELLHICFLEAATALG